MAKGTKAPKVAAKRVRKGARKGTKRPMKRSKAMSQPDMAKLSVVRTLAKGTTNQMYAYNSFALADYQRAVNVAGSFQRYRITGIKLTFKPQYDTFAQPVLTASAKPYLYYMIDKSGAIPDNITLEGLKQAGARPIAFDEKPITISWKPSVLNEIQSTVGGVQVSVGTGYKVSPILSTNNNPGNPGVWNASTVNHLGVKWYMENSGTVPLDVNVEAELQFEFFKAIYPQLSSSAAVGLQYAKLDQSPDGVEGGTDGITIPLGV